MRRRATIEIKRRATLWAIYETSKDGVELVRNEVSLSGKPECKASQVAIAIAKGHVVFTTAYDDFVKNSTKSEFVEEDTAHEN